MHFKVTKSWLQQPGWDFSIQHKILFQHRRGEKSIGHAQCTLFSTSVTVGVEYAFFMPNWY